MLLQEPGDCDPATQDPEVNWSLLQKLRVKAAFSKFVSRISGQVRSAIQAMFTIQFQGEVS